MKIIQIISSITKDEDGEMNEWLYGLDSLGGVWFINLSLAGKDVKWTKLVGFNDFNHSQ